MPKKTFQRFGDGYIQEMTEPELMKDLEEGSKDAAERSGAIPLTGDEMKHLFDIYASPRRFVGVKPGDEIVLSHDGGNPKLQVGVSGGAGHGLDVGRRLCTEIYERIFGSDTMDFGHTDPNMIIPMGIKTEIDSVQKKITIIDIATKKIVTSVISLRLLIN